MTKVFVEKSVRKLIMENYCPDTMPALCVAEYLMEVIPDLVDDDSVELTVYYCPVHDLFDFKLVS